MGCSVLTKAARPVSILLLAAVSLPQHQQLMQLLSSSFTPSVHMLGLADGAIMRKQMCSRSSGSLPHLMQPPNTPSCCVSCQRKAKRKNLLLPHLHLSSQDCISPSARFSFPSPVRVSLADRNQCAAAQVHANRWLMTAAIMVPRL